MTDVATIYYDKLSYILPYEAIDMITNINNNIQEHFIDHLNKYVNIVFSIKEKSAKITTENKDKIIRKLGLFVPAPVRVKWGPENH